MIPWLDEHQPFPPVSQALDADSDAPGLLAASQELSVERLESAYRQGIFPWYSAGQPVLWWSTDPRMVLRPEQFKVQTSFARTLKQVLRDDAWQIRTDTAFRQVMQACAHTPRAGQDGTWITDAIIAAYTALHQQGKAHSVEVWHQDQLVGGLYGVCLGRMFYGESMFAHRRDASKIALAALCAYLLSQNVDLIDCQQETAHLASLGASPISRSEFVAHVARAVDLPDIEAWGMDKQVLGYWLARRQPIEVLRGSGKGLWGDEDAQMVEKLRDEWIND